MPCARQDDGVCVIPESQPVPTALPQHLQGDWGHRDVCPRTAAPSGPEQHGWSASVDKVCWYVHTSEKVCQREGCSPPSVPPLEWLAVPFPRPLWVSPLSKPLCMLLPRAVFLRCSSAFIPWTPPEAAHGLPTGAQPPWPGCNLSPTIPHITLSSECKHYSCTQPHVGLNTEFGILGCHT